MYNYAGKFRFAHMYTESDCISAMQIKDNARRDRGAEKNYISVARKVNAPCYILHIKRDLLKWNNAEKRQYFISIDPRIDTVAQ